MDRNSERKVAREESYMGTEKGQRTRVLRLLVIYVVVFSFSVAGQTFFGDSDREAQAKDSGKEDKQELREKLQKIVIPEMNFDSAKVTDVIRFLHEKSKELDPEGEGVNFLIQLKNGGAATQQPGGAEQGRKSPDEKKESFEGFGEKDFEGFDREENSDERQKRGKDDSEAESAQKRVPRVTMNMRNVPLLEIIRYICQATHLKYAVDSHAVIIAGQNVPLERMQTRAYLLKAGVLSGEGDADDADGDVSEFGEE